LDHQNNYIERLRINDSIFKSFNIFNNQFERST